MTHYFSRDPGGPSEQQRIELFLPDITLTLTTDRGVFSADRVDTGTKYLLSESPPPQSECRDILDLGCGYGAIACALAIRAPAATVWAVDVNRRALDLCRQNARASGLANIETSEPDEVPPNVHFDLIYSNPPVRVGKAELHRILRRWFGRLREHGHGYLVMNKHLGADSLARWLRDEGWLVNRLGSRQGYRLLDVTRPS